MEDMGLIYRDLRPLPRSYPSELPVRALGYHPCHRGVRDRRFDRVVFIVVLAGRGTLHRDGRSCAVEAPALIVGRPGTRIQYGSPEGWEEFYFNYTPDFAMRLEKRGLLPADLPLWRLHHALTVRRRVREILDLVKTIGNLGIADVIDRHCETLLVECRVSEATPPLSKRERSLHALRGYLQQHYRQSLDLDRLASQHGMSPADCRRRWRAAWQMSPSQFITQLRIGDACRLLVESEDSIAQISAAAGYQDPLYFSRRFRQIMGETASAYRARMRHGQEA